MSRVIWIDFCRVYTAFFVILRHVDRPWFGNVPSVNYMVDLFNFRSLIFFFFLVSGYFSHRPEKGTWLDTARTKKLVLPYIFWCLMGLLVVSIPSIAEGSWAWLTPARVASELGLMSWCYWDYTNVPLWFLRTLLLLALFAPLIHRLPTPALAALVMVSFAVSDVLCDGDREVCNSLDRPYHTATSLPFRMYESELAFGFFAGGIVMRRFLNAAELAARLRWWAFIPVLASLALLLPVKNLPFYPPVRSSALVLLGVSTIVSIGCLCEYYLPRFTRVVAKLGSASFFIYVTHYLVLLGFRYVLTGTWHGDLGMPLCYFLPFIIFAVCVALFFLLKKICPPFMRVFAMAKV